ncbi:UDP-N-acetylmuramate--L-alanine ligase [Erysipelothrix larvae]|uniref:UDP-N-acetylmuramate--L-alanine ligase n=1 Tax=Erysipelothrix larvae TaxID=1514105 RepID=UPI000B23B3BD|nr:UDP-N-acetylmuramate--L-alanine ligase [Erysipelothrix larvae]
MNHKDIYFIGIKGTGMSALALICKDLGYNVSGSDLDKHFFTETRLIEANIPIYSFNPSNIRDHTIVIVGNAFDDTFEEVVAASNNKTVTVYRYHQFLGHLMGQYRTISVSGTHGKTTTTTLLKDMLSEYKNTGYLIGDGSGLVENDDYYFAVEACEFRRHFLAYHPDIAVMTNFELDHVDYFKDEADYLSAYNEFSKNVKEVVIAWGDDPHFARLNLAPTTLTYGFSTKNDFQAINIDRSETHSYFDVIAHGQFIKRFDLPLVGDHMILNALSVIAVGLYEEIPVDLIERGLQNFSGAKRRYSIETVGESILIDDYAHHPTEIKVTLEATRIRYPNKKIVAIFKPHRVGRIYHFINEFITSLSIADEVAICPFTSIDDAQDGIDIDATFLQSRIEGAFMVDEDEQSVQALLAFEPAVYVFMSDKDVYNLKNLLKDHLQ